MKRLTALAGLLALSASATLHAGANCPNVPESQWMHVLDMQKKIVNEYGIAIKKFQTDGYCYEVYGWAKSADGKKFEKVEVYFNPVSGEIVKKVVEE